MPNNPSNQTRLTRRTVLSGGAGVIAAGLLPVQHAWTNTTILRKNLPSPPPEHTPDDLARDEQFWESVASYYDRTQGIVNLEHGYWGKMARPVREAYLDATDKVNTQNSYYARREYGADYTTIVKRVASALGAHTDEITLTRNATESIHALILQYRHLEPGDTVLYADVDYPSFKSLVRSLEETRGVVTKELELPPRANQAELLQAYVNAFEANPKIKLMLLTHVSNQHGLVLPIADIAKEARARGIDVVCDSAQSWGLLNYRVTDLGIDWAGFNLHKWIGAPLGVGALYMKRGSLDKIRVHDGDKGRDASSIASRIHMGTMNFASFLTVPAALDFHEAVGGANKEARLRYLRGLWTAEAENLDNIEVLGGADEASWTGMAAFRQRGKTSADDAQALQKRLEEDFGIFTVARYGLASGACVRVTPQVFTSPAEIAALSKALRAL